MGASFDQGNAPGVAMFPLSVWRRTLARPTSKGVSPRWTAVVFYRVLLLLGLMVAPARTTASRWDEPWEQVILLRMNLNEYAAQLGLDTRLKIATYVAGTNALGINQLISREASRPRPRAEQRTIRRRCFLALVGQRSRRCMRMILWQACTPGCGSWRRVLRRCTR